MRRAIGLTCAALLGCGGATASSPVIIERGGLYPVGRGLVINAPDVNGALLFTKSVSDVKLRPVTILNAYRAIETSVGVRVVNLASTGLKARNLARDGIRLRDAHRVSISDFDLSHRALASEGKHLPEGIAIVAGRDIRIRNGRIDGFRMKAEKGKYTNGDGIATEGGVDGLLIENVVASNNSDGGFDLKGSNIILKNLEAVNNSRAFRIWSSSAVATNLRARNFRGAGLWLGEGAAIVIEKFTASSDTPAPVFRFESGARIIVKSCDLTGMPKGSRLLQADGRAAELRLGPGCKL